MLTDQELEQKLSQSPAPRVTKEYIESRIEEKFFDRLTATVTTCAIILDNRFTVLGESACVNPENYDQEIAKRVAYDNAFTKLWPLFGFLLAESNMTESILKKTR